MTTYWKNVC